MARLSRAGGKASKAKARKAKLRKASPAKGRDTSKAGQAKAAKTRRRIARSSIPPKRRSASDLTKELKEARKQQGATSEILRVISQSPTDTQPVFEAMVRTAVRLLRCDMSLVTLNPFFTTKPAGEGRARALTPRNCCHPG
jgi:hypothetical protein